MLGYHKKRRKRNGRVETSTEENPKISFKKEGVYTITLKAKNKNGESDEIVKQDFITVSKDATKEEVNLALNKTATASGQTAASEAPEKAVDGIVNTKWCTTNSGGQWMQIDLGKISTLTEIVINHAEMGGEGSSLNTAAYHVEVSEDGQNYKEVLRVEKNTAGLTEDPIAVIHGRYVKLWIDEPTQGGDNAARIYEVEVKDLEEAVEIPPVYDPSKEVSTEALESTLELAKKADREGALKSVKARFEAAVEEAEALLVKVESGDEEVTQEMVDAANQELQDAMKGLEIKQGDKAELNKVIAEAEKLNKSDYEEKEFAEMQKALKEAKEMAANGDATQEMVDASVKSLQKAIGKLVPVKNNGAGDQNSQTKPEKEDPQGDSQKEPVKTGNQTATTGSLLGLMFAAILVVVAKFRKEKNM